MSVGRGIVWLLGLVLAVFCIWVLANGGLGISAELAACGTPPAQETSSDYLLRSAHCIFDASDNPQDKLRLALIDDLYIKGWAYSVLNKACFWASILLGLTILVYPALGPVFSTPAAEGEEAPRKNWFQRAISTASVQTAITALAAATFAFYAHYKERQSGVETLMRELLVRETVDAAYMADVVARIGRMDAGFGFSSVAGGDQ